MPREFARKASRWTIAGTVCFASVAVIVAARPAGIGAPPCVESLFFFVPFLGVSRFRFARFSWGVTDCLSVDSVSAPPWARFAVVFRVEPLGVVHLPARAINLGAVERLITELLGNGSPSGNGLRLIR